jgi:hypothetical protein
MRAPMHPPIAIINAFMAGDRHDFQAIVIEA